MLLLLTPLTACQQLVGWSDTADGGDPNPDITAPSVTSTSPADGDVDVAFNTSIFATFDENMAPLTLSTATFTIEDGAFIEGTVVPVGNRATVFAPADALEPDHEYTATITIGATDLAGNALAQDYVWTFTTLAVNVDPTAPSVLFTDPDDEETGVPLDAMVHATFDEAMDPTTVIGANFEVAGPGTSPVDGLVSYDALTHTGTFTPDLPLLIDTTYTATVTTGASDLAGTPMNDDYVWTFSTEPAVFLPPPVDLGILESFVAVAGVAISNSGPSYLNGDVGLSPGVASSCTGCIPPHMFITGELHIADSIAEQAKADLTDALIEAQAYPPGLAAPFLVSADLHGQILAPGVYTSPSTMQISTNGILTLDGQGNPNSFWVFQVGSALTVNPGARVILTNGARAANVFWAVGSSSTILANVSFQGTVLAQASNSVGTNASVVGRLLCTEGEISLLSNSITLPTP